MATTTTRAEKPEFKSKEESLAVAEVSIKLATIALVLSTLSSATSFGFLLLALVPVEYLDTETWTGWIVYALIFGVSGYVAHAIDFHGVQKYGRHALGELVAIISRKFYTSIMRKLYTLLSLSVFVVCFSISFFTSRDGSKMVAGFARIESGVAEQSTEAVKKAQDLKERSLKPYQDRLAEANKKMEEEVQRERDRYNGPASKDYAERKVRKAYERQGGLVYEAQQALKSQEELALEQEKTLLGSIQTDQNRKIQSIDAKSTGIMTLLQTLGIYPLFIAIILIGIDAVYRVSSQIKDHSGQGFMEWMREAWGGMRGK